MRNRIHSPNLSSCLPLALAAAFLFFIAPAMAQSPLRHLASVPLLKGTYVFNQLNNCVHANGTLFQSTGSLSLNPGTGTFELDAYNAEGDPLTLDHVKQHGTFSNSGKTITFGTATYQVTYGKLEKGIATYLAFIAAADGCASQISLSRQ
jgi:hypothetical protein